jgi:hypothetical protein
MVGPRGPAIAHNCALGPSGRALFQRTPMASLEASFLILSVATAPLRAVGTTFPMRAAPEHVDGILKVISILQWRTPFFGLFFALNCPEPIEQTQPESGQ